MSTDSAQSIITQLSRDHSEALLSWAKGRFADQRDAEEVVADTLVKAWKAIDRFDPQQGSQRAWLFAIAKNAAADHHRRSRRHLHSVPVAEPDMGSRSDTEIDRLVETSHVLDALRSLSAEHRSAVLDAYFGGLTTSQIASNQQIPTGTAKSRLYYALKAMRSHLEERGVVR